MIVLDIKRKDYFLKTAKKVESQSRDQVVFKHTKKCPVKDRFYKTWLSKWFEKRALMVSIEESIYVMHK